MKYLHFLNGFSYDSTPSIVCQAKKYMIFPLFSRCNCALRRWAAQKPAILIALLL